MKQNVKWFLTFSIVIFASLAAAAYPEAALPYEEQALAGSSRDGLRLTSLPAGDGRLFGYVDEEGVIAIPPRFSDARDFADDKALVHEADAWKLIDTKGNTLLDFDPSCGEILFFNEESGAGFRDGKCALIGASGKPITGFEYRYIEQLGEGLFLATKDPAGDERIPHWRDAWSRWEILSAEGKTLTPPKYYKLGNIPDGRDGYPALLPVSENIHGAGGKSGFLDTFGREVLPLVYDGVTGFTEGIGTAQKNAGDISASDTYITSALVDSSGRLTTDFVFGNVMGFHEGLSLVAWPGNRYSVIDRQGNTLFEDIGLPQESDFHNGYLSTVKDGQDIMLESPIKKNRQTHIYVDGAWLYTDEEPLIQDGRMLLPVRQLANALGYDVTWDAAKRAVVLQDTEKIARMWIDDPVASVNIFDDGLPVQEVYLDVPPMLKNGRTLVPFRFAIEALGAQVEWDADTQTAHVDKKQRG